MDRFLHGVRALAAAQDQDLGQPRFGIVANVNPNDYTAKVLLQPENVLTGSLPVLTGWVGQGWGLVMLPSIGDAVLVLAQEGHAEHGIVVGGAYTSAMQPPQIGGAPVPAGEAVLFHASGAYVRLGNDGSLNLIGSSNGAVNITGAGTGTITLTVGSSSVAIGSGGTTITNGLTVDGIVFGTHEHGGVQAGEDNTGAPVA